MTRKIIKDRSIIANITHNETNTDRTVTEILLKIDNEIFNTDKIESGEHRKILAKITLSRFILPLVVKTR